MSELFLPTLRDDPADAEVPSHKLLIRAGYIRPIGPGLYSWLPLGLRVLRKHWGPINERAAELNPQADALLLQVQSLLDAPLVA